MVNNWLILLIPAYHKINIDLYELTGERTKKKGSQWVVSGPNSFIFSLFMRIVQFQHWWLLWKATINKVSSSFEGLFRLQLLLKLFNAIFNTYILKFWFEIEWRFTVVYCTEGLSFSRLISVNFLLSLLRLQTNMNNSLKWVVVFLQNYKINKIK